MTDSIPTLGAEEIAEGEALALWMERLGEWDENRVWLDGAWWEVEHYGAATAKSKGRIFTDVVIRRMEPQPTPIAALASASIPHLPS